MLISLDPAAAEQDPAAGACDVLRLLAELGHSPVRLRPDGAGALIGDQP